MGKQGRAAVRYRLSQAAPPVLHLLKEERSHRALRLLAVRASKKQERLHPARKCPELPDGDIPGPHDANVVSDPPRVGIDRAHRRELNVGGAEVREPPVLRTRVTSVHAVPFRLRHGRH